jgi:hypothetical protein
MLDKHPSQRIVHRIAKEESLISAQNDGIGSFFGMSFR